jgi:DNA invertase Pin-like site-specific DNA recombinase
MIGNNSAVEPEISRRRLQKSRNRTRLMDGGMTPQEYGSGTKAVIYKRVSSEEQIEGYSLAAQERGCRDFAERRGWDIVMVYEDPGHSGKNDERPGFQKMIADARQQAFKVILIHKLDRFSRHIDSTLKYFRELNDYDVTIASVTEEFDYSTPMGRMFFRMMAVFAQWYLENLSAETVKGKQERVRAGKHNGRLSFGYQVGPQGIAVIVPEEAEAVRKGFELYSTGQYTDRQIAAFLNEQGFITRHRRRWSKDTVRSFLQNEFYYGKVAYREQLLPGKHEPIIEVDLFQKCQEVRRQHARRPKSFKKQVQKTYLLQRIIRCDRCERHLRMQNASGHYYYKEASLERGLTCEHAGKSIRMDIADAQVLEALKALRLPADWQEELRRQLEDKDEIRMIETRREQINDQLRRLGRAFADGFYDDQEYEHRSLALKTELEGLVIPDSARVFDSGLQLDNLGDYLEDATEDEQSEIAHLIMTAVYADLDRNLVIRLRPSPEFTFMFRVAAEEMGWQEKEIGVFNLSD